jgi:methionyl-tRNA synthetase
MKPEITYDEFARLDIRVGQVVEADLPDWSNKLIRYVMDLGPEIGKRVLFSGIREFYKPEDLMGKKYPVIVNLAPKKMGTEESEGMMLMTDGEEGPVLIELPADVEVGTVVR